MDSPHRDRLPGIAMTAVQRQPSNQSLVLQADSEQPSDNDSALGDDISVYTESLRQSIFEFPSRYGRTYHSYKEGRYTLPNDEDELDRLDIFHHMMLRAMSGNLFWAPLPKDFSGRALDMATGTGIWAIDFADLFPNAIVIGNDLSPTMSTTVPPNCHFYVDDIEDDWTYGDNEKFDFIHARFLTGGIGDWPKLMSQVFQHTKPGGWVEFQDWNTWLYSQDGSLPQDSALNKFHQLTSGGRHAQGFNMRPGPELEGWIRAAGFVDVQFRKILLPLGIWPKAPEMKEVGALNALQMEKGFESISLATLPVLPPSMGGPMSFEEIQVFVAQIKANVRNRKIHGLYDFWVVWARRP